MPRLPNRRALAWAALAFWWAWAACARAAPEPPPEHPLGRLAVRALTTHDGLPQNSIQALAMDRAGRLWVGTVGGAAYQDGSGWTTLDIPDEANSDYVSAILPASDGAVWIARQDGGVSRLSRGRWETFTPRQGFVHPRVNALAETRDAEGRPVVWAGTHGAGLARYEAGRWTVLGPADGLPDARVWRLCRGLSEAGREVLYIGTDNGGVAVWEGGRIRPLPSLPRATVNSFLQARDRSGTRTLWAGTYGFGVAHLEGDTWRRFTQKDGLPSDFVTDLAETQDPDGSWALWACTLRGLAVLRKGRWEALDARRGLPGNVMHRLLATPTPEGTTRLWVGTGGHGLFILDPAGWRKVDRFDGLPDSSVHSLLEVDGQLYAGTALGLARFAKGRWEHVFGQERVTALLATGPPGKRALWVASLSGLTRWEAGRAERFDQWHHLPNNRIAHLAGGTSPDGRPRVWVATQGGGLAGYDGRTWTTFGRPQGLAADTLNCLLETAAPKGGRYLWIGTRGAGVFRLNPDGSWTSYRQAEGLPNLNILCMGRVLRSDGSEEIWAGTFGKGLARLALDPPGARWESLRLGALQERAFDMIQGILQARNGEIYISTIRGVARIIPGDGSPGGARTYTYTTEDGLPSEYCSSRALLQDTLGRICVGTVEGLAFFDIHRALPDRAPKPLRLRGVAVPGLGVLESPESGTLSLTHRQHNLAFEFTLVALTRTREHRFRTQLEGLESEPTPWSPHRRREFTGLPPGRYAFLVWARDHAGNASGPLRFAFSIRPAPWQTWWFRGLAALATTLAAWAATLWRERLLRRRNLELTALVGYRTGELQHLNSDLRREIRERRAAEKAKDEFTAMVSHELRTPLTAIRGSLGLLASGSLEGQPEQRKDMLVMAQRNTMRLLTMVNDLLDIQKIEAGKLEIRPCPLELGPTLDQVVRANQGYAAEYGAAFRLDPAPGGARILADPLRLEQALANLLSNAAKFATGDREILVRAEEGPSGWRIHVRNPGDPIPEAFRARIFQKFSQAETGTTRAVKGTGLGLAITKAFIEGMGGAVGFESLPTHTTFWVEVPKA